MAACISRASAAESTTLYSVGKHYPSLDLVKNTIKTVASRDFPDHPEAFVAAHNWQRRRLLQQNTPAPYFACSEYGKGHDAAVQLKRTFSAPGVSTITNTKEHGACFIVTAVPGEAEALIDDPSAFGLSSVGPFLSMLKLAPGLLDHSPEEWVEDSASSALLATSYGDKIKPASMMGLSVRLSPGVMKAREPSVEAFIDEWRNGLGGGSLGSMRHENFWTHPDLLEGADGHLAGPRGALLAREWSGAAEVLQRIAEAQNRSVGEACEWRRAHVHPAEDDLVLLTGVSYFRNSVPVSSRPSKYSEKNDESSQGGGWTTS